MNNKAELLTEPHNYAIVQLPGRAFPGVVMQGDSLNAMVSDLGDVLALIEEGKPEEALEDLSYLHQRLKDVRDFYAKTLKSRGMKLPFIEIA